MTDNFFTGSNAQLIALCKLLGPSSIRIGANDMVATNANAGSLNFSAYSVRLGDGSLNIVLVNKDATSGVNASIGTGAPVTAACKRQH